jgi:hypothetical protein
MSFDWSGLPRLLRERIEDEKARLCDEMSSEDTLRSRTKIAVYRDILSLAVPDDTNANELEMLARQIEDTDGY